MRLLSIALPPVVWLFATARGTLPPLEPFFAEPPRSRECISPSGRRIAFLGPGETGAIRLWVLDPDDPSQPRAVTGEGDDPVVAYFWLPGDGLLLQVAASDGRPAFFLADTPSARPRAIRFDAPAGLTLAGVTTDQGPCLIFGMSGRTDASPELFRLHPGPDARLERIPTDPARTFRWCFDRAGQPVAGLRWTDGGNKEIADLRRPSVAAICRTEPGDDLRLLDTDPEGSRVLVVTNQGSDLTRLERIDLRTGEANPVASDPLGRVDVDDVVLDRRSREPLAVRYTDERIRWQPLHPDFAAMLERVRAEIPDEPVSVSCCDRRQRWLLKCRDRAGLPRLWFLDLNRGAVLLPWPGVPGLDPSGAGETRSLVYQARDGTTVPAFLTLPAKGHAPWPLVVFPHGGPHMRTVPGFDGRVQFLASRGYAVLQPNFRGSRGYGKAFMNAGDGQWGRGVVQADVSDGVAHLVRDGLADKGRVAILGGSYGGYAALAGLIFTPDLYAAGVCLFGISDLPAYATYCPAEWRPYAGDTVRRLGDPATAAGRAVLDDLSPVNHAAAVTAPLLIYHGLNDKLIPVGHTRRMVAAMERAGKPVTCLLAPDEGHGFSRPESEMAVYRAIEIFLHEHIGGSVGPDPAEEVGRRLVRFRDAAEADAVRSRDGGVPVASGEGDGK